MCKKVHFHCIKIIFQKALAVKMYIYITRLMILWNTRASQSSLEGPFVGVEFQHVTIPFISRNIHRNRFLVSNNCIQLSCHGNKENNMENYNSWDDNSVTVYTGEN